MGPKETSWQSGLRWVAYALCLGLGYYYLAKLGLRLAVPPHGITVLWPPNGITIALLLLSERRRWLPFLGVVVVTNLLLSDVDNESMLINLGYCAANVGEIAAGAYLMRRFCGPTVELRKMREVVYLITLVALLSCAFSATIASLAAVYAIKGTLFLSAWSTWLVGDATGVLLLTPVILSWAPRAGERFDVRAFPRKVEAVVLFALLAALSALIFGSSDGTGQERIPMMYLVFPFVLWAAVRFGPRGASLASLMVAAFAVVEASLGHGPRFFESEDTASVVYWIQIYLLVVNLSGLVLAAVWSERADATAALEESERRLARTEALALVMTTHISLDGRWLKVPPTLCKRLGYKEASLLSRTLADVVHPGDFDAFWERCRGLLEGKGKSCDAEVRLLRWNKKKLAVDISLSPVTDSNGTPLHFLAHLRDITERKRAEELLKKEKEHTSQILSAAPAIICGLNPDGTIASVNPAITHITGYAPDEIVGKSLWELLFPGPLSAEAERARAALEQNPGAGCETVLRAKDGSERTAAWSAAVRTDSEGRPLEMILIGSDVTARKHAEEALHRTLEELESRVQARTAELVAANRSLAIEIGERRRVGEALQHARDELEARVLERTQELTRTNKALAERTEELTRTNEALAERTREQTRTNTVLAERTEELTRTNEALAERSQELTRTNEALAERTEELTQTNEALASEVDERRRAEVIISRQANELFELSTPIVRLRPGMELVPLVGTFNGRRAEQLMAHLLERIAAEGSHAVLLDVTGVPSIERDTAEYLLKTISAVRLLGAEAVLTGVRPSIARTLVDLGIDLSGIETQASVALGLDSILRRQSRRRTPGRRQQPAQ